MLTDSPVTTSPRPARAVAGSAIAPRRARASRQELRSRSRRGPRGGSDSVPYWDAGDADQGAHRSSRSSPSSMSAPPRCCPGVSRPTTGGALVECVRRAGDRARAQRHARGGRGGAADGGLLLGGGAGDPLRVDVPTDAAPIPVGHTPPGTAHPARAEADEWLSTRLDMDVRLMGHTIPARVR